MAELDENSIVTLRDIKQRVLSPPKLGTRVSTLPILEIRKGLLYSDLAAPSSWGTYTKSTVQIWTFNSDLDSLEYSGEVLTIYNFDPKLTLPRGTNIDCCFYMGFWQPVPWVGCGQYVSSLM